MRFSDELEELNTCRCQATLPSERYAFLKGWLRWGSEPSNVAAVTSLDYDHEVRSRVRAGISIAHWFSCVSAAGSCLPWERAPSVVAALQEELGLGDEAILSHVVECPFILSLSWELHMAPSLVLLQTWVPECNDDAAATRAWVCSTGESSTDAAPCSTRLLALAVTSNAGVTPSAEEFSRLIDEFGVRSLDPMIAAYWHLTEEERALQRHLRLNIDQMMVMRRLSSPIGLAYYFTPSMERGTIASLEALRSDLELGTAEFSFFVVRMPALVEAHLERNEWGWLFHRVQGLGFTYAGRGSGGQVYFGNHAQLGKLVVAVADVLAQGVGVRRDTLYPEDHFLPRYSRFNELPRRFKDSCLARYTDTPTEADLARYTTTMGQIISVSSGDELGPDLDDLFDRALSRYDHDDLAPHASGYRPIFDDSLSPFEAAYFETSDLAQSVFTAHRRRKATMIHKEVGKQVRPLVMIDLENVGDAVQLLPQLHAMDGIEVRAYVAETHPLRAKATHLVPVGLSKGSKKLFDAVDIRIMFDAGQYANINPDAKTNILVVSKDNFATTAAAVVNPADATFHATDLTRQLPRFWAQQLGVQKLTNLAARTDYRPSHGARTRARRTSNSKRRPGGR